MLSLAMNRKSSLQQRCMIIPNYLFKIIHSNHTVAESLR